MKTTASSFLLFITTSSALLSPQVDGLELGLARRGLALVDSLKEWRQSMDSSRAPEVAPTAASGGTCVDECASKDASSCEASFQISWSTGCAAIDVASLRARCFPCQWTSTTTTTGTCVVSAECREQQPGGPAVGWAGCYCNAAMLDFKPVTTVAGPRIVGDEPEPETDTRVYHQDDIDRAHHYGGKSNLVSSPYEDKADER